MRYKLNVNGKAHEVNVDADTPLLWVLRDELRMTGTKFGCGIAACGACTVHIDGVATRSCTYPVDVVGTSKIETIEGLQSDVGKRLQAAWIAEEVPQCGYCQSGMIMAAVDLLTHTPRPSDAEINAAMTNICRCGTYSRVRAAIHRAANS